MSENLEFEIPNYITIVQLQQITDGDYCYVAFHPELPSVLSQGATKEEATENLIEATELAISHLISNNLPIPSPTEVNDLTIGFSEFYFDIPTPTSNFVEAAPPESTINPSDKGEVFLTAPFFKWNTSLPQT